MRSKEAYLSWSITSFASVIIIIKAFYLTTMMRFQKENRRRRRGRKRASLLRQLRWKNRWKHCEGDRDMRLRALKVADFNSMIGNIEKESWPKNDEREVSILIDGDNSNIHLTIFILLLFILLKYYQFDLDVFIQSKLSKYIFSYIW